MMYFDNAATTLEKPVGVYRAVQRAMQTMSGIGRGGYRQANLAAEEVYACRELAGELFGADPSSVVFTMNATHALNLAIKTLVKPGGRAIISGFEHNAVWRPLTALGAEITVAGRKLYDSADLLECFAGALRRGADAVICTQVSNVFGWRLPVEELGTMCRRCGVPFVVDCSQSAGKLSVTLSGVQADFLAMPGHKGLYGPQGTGLLICGRLPEPLLQGGTGSLSRSAEMPQDLPDRVEAGTHNVPGICGLAAGLRFIRAKTPDKIGKDESRLAKKLVSGLRELKQYMVYFGENQTGTISLQHKHLDCEVLADLLAGRDIAVRAGLHCAPLAHESAHTLEEGTVRVSFSAFHTDAEVEALLQHLREL